MPRPRNTVTRESLLAHGLQFASHRGLAAVSIAPIAAQAGIKKSSFFTHFPTKESLQIALLDTAAFRFRETVLVPATHERAGRRRLRRVFELWMGWTTRAGLTGDIFVAAANELDDMPGPVRDHLVSLQEFWIQGLVGLVQEAVEIGELPEDTDPRQVTFEVTGLYLAHQATKRLLRDDSADARGLGAFDRLLDSPPRRSPKPSDQRKKSPRQVKSRSSKQQR